MLIPLSARESQFVLLFLWTAKWCCRKELWIGILLSFHKGWSSAPYAKGDGEGSIFPFTFPRHWKLFGKGLVLSKNHWQVIGWTICPSQKTIQPQPQRLLSKEMSALQTAVLYFTLHGRPSSWPSPRTWSHAWSTCTPPTTAHSSPCEATSTTASPSTTSPRSPWTACPMMRKTPPGSPSPLSPPAGGRVLLLSDALGLIHRGAILFLPSIVGRGNWMRIPASWFRSILVRFAFRTKMSARWLRPMVGAVYKVKSILFIPP